MDAQGTQKVITLGNHHQIPLGSYVKGVSFAIAHPQQEFKHGLTGWWPVTGKDIRREFLASVQDRINRHITVSEDRKGPTARKLAHIRKVGRSCKWCGSRFFPKGVNDHFCSPACQRDYNS